MSHAIAQSRSRDAPLEGRTWEPKKGTVTVNRRERLLWHKGMTIADLLELCKYTFPQIIVTINGDLVSRDAYQETDIPDGADVRVIHLMAGG